MTRRFHPTLLLWLLRPILPVTLIELAIALPYVLLRPDVLEYSDPWPALFIAAHCVFIVRQVGVSRGGMLGFLYTRGFSRNVLWAHIWLATAVVVLIAWLPPALTVWLGVRNDWQDRAWNPLFPLMDPLETPVPLVWLAEYAVLLPMLHYTWARFNQPTRGRSAGLMLLAALTAAILRVLDSPNIVTPAQWLLALGCAVLVVASFWGGWRLHRSIEVRS